MIKKGIVMEVNKNKVGLLTSGGEFVYVKNLTICPSIGEIYESEEIIKKSPFYKNTKKLSIVAASLLIIFLFSTFFRFYNTAAYAVTIDINPCIKLELNKWNKIIKITALNTDGTNVIKNLNLKNKTLETGIQLILKEAQRENYINDNYKNGSKSINLDFKGDVSRLDITDIENDLKNFKINYNIKTSKGNKTNYSEYKKSNRSIENNHFNNSTNNNNNNSNKNNNNKNNNNTNNNTKNNNIINSKDSDSKSKINNLNKENNSYINKNNSPNKKTNNSSNGNKNNSPEKKVQNDTNAKEKESGNKNNVDNKNLNKQKNSVTPPKKYIVK
ncbi:anti-sigma-I factor RsgI family protein [Haloimpatiens lingqiaonensis]|uniref:anti-sigma-I factor RsgI family protein n=1 Tax=Haloimpatiens lingqiaonensis TaxID=1380675 RepID=UPI0010FEAA70|nr:anti-sigma factor domain-containing protein [Haloimpatiens lingqiaonensis]